MPDPKKIEPQPAAASSVAFRPAVYMTCVEAGFLSTAMSPGFIANKEVTRDQFLDAFRLGSGAGAPVAK
jgi:hypothetical protein